MSPAPHPLARARSIARAYCSLLALASCLVACADPEADDDLGSETDPFDDVAGACDPEAEPAADPFADCVEAFDPDPAVSFGHDAMPDVVLGPPQGAGETMGGTHVASLGCGGSITLHFSAPWPTDGPGPDLVVFENAFTAGSTTFIEPAEVLVSADGRQWHAFPCRPEAGQLDGCAGLAAVLAVDATLDPAAAGGDVFDLADLGLAEARYVRIIDRTAEHYGTDTWCRGAAGGFDLDAIAGLETAR